MSRSGKGGIASHTGSGNANPRGAALFVEGETLFTGNWRCEVTGAVVAVAGQMVVAVSRAYTTPLPDRSFEHRQRSFQPRACPRPSDRVKQRRFHQLPGPRLLWSESKNSGAIFTPARQEEHVPPDGSAEPGVSSCLVGKVPRFQSAVAFVTALFPAAD